MPAAHQHTSHMLEVLVDGEEQLSLLTLGRCSPLRDNDSSFSNLSNARSTTSLPAASAATQSFQVTNACPTPSIWPSLALGWGVLAAKEELALTLSLKKRRIPLVLFRCVACIGPLSLVRHERQLARSSQASGLRGWRLVKAQRQVPPDLLKEVKSGMPIPRLVTSGKALYLVKF